MLSPVAELILGMAENFGQYRREGSVTLIDIRLDCVDQLFNSFDPSPFRQKDLDRDAEEYIVDAAEDFRPAEQIKLVFHLPNAIEEDDKAREIPDALHNYFSYKLDTAKHRLRQMRRDGRISLVIGLSFLAVCVGIRQVLLATGTTLGAVLAEGFLICGWVAMWRPLDILLYEWWPIYRRCRTYAKLGAITVEIQRS
jgi:hypothetical protein